MDAISHRIKKVAESVLENEALIGSLDRSAADVLQGWGVKHATRAAEDTHSLDDESAEKAMYPQLKASRRLLRAIRVWLEHEKEATAEERQKLWAKVEKRAQGLYGDAISLPSPSQFSGKRPVEFIENLREWLEGDTQEAEVEKNAKKDKKKKKGFFQSLFGR
ncbi:MAG: hypothetical protein GY755_18245 [Chloroflexi bacterium]|nr:hypothetical protein [Chloroflexota bacterium]